uniref:hypothetical protein n=1 Tax=Escherichia coli TaxID=562 RepID=UPI0013D610DA
VQHAILEAGLLDLGEMAQYLSRSKADMARIVGNLIANGRLNARLFQHEPLVTEEARYAVDPGAAHARQSEIREMCFL